MNARGIGSGFGEPAVEPRRVQSRKYDCCGALVARRGEDDALAVRRPAAHAIAPGMIRQALRIAARGGHDVDVGVAADRRGERDLRAVRREVRIGLDAGRRR